MTEEVYNGKRAALDREHKEKCFALAKEFAMSNNTVKVGDVVSRPGMTIIVDRIGIEWGRYGTFPQCCYSGRMLTKAGEPRKDGAIGYVFQSEVK